ncbi:MAG TPA: hypothetical protein VFV39_00220 [Limnobacter sp.]|nr:hypothetical protein [Limnobacter sp.]
MRSTNMSELLPFRVEQAFKPSDFQAVALARQLAYGKHLPAFGQSLAKPDADDLGQDCTVLLALSKLDNSCIGTVRIQIAQGNGLRLEDSFSLPKALRTGRIAEISRLAIPARANGLALRLMLIKAAYWFCRNQQVDRCFLCVRHPVDRQYRRFDLDDVLPAEQFIPMKHIGGIPHRVLWFDVFGIEARWLLNNNPLHCTYFEMQHPDLLDNIQARTQLQESEQSLRVQG